MDLVYLASDGVPRGVLMMCDRKMVENVEEFIKEYAMTCSFNNMEDNFMWAFAGVYRSNNNRNKHLIWKKLVGVHNWWDLPWFIGRDFNVIRFPIIHLGENKLRPVMLAFS